MKLDAVWRTNGGGSGVSVVSGSVPGGSEPGSDSHVTDGH